MSGTAKFVDNQNADIIEVLAKNHNIQGCMRRNSGCMKVYNDIDKSKGREPTLSPKLLNETRWGGECCLFVGCNAVLTQIFSFVWLF